MLSQVELGKSAPTINVLWRIAHALQVPFSALLLAKEVRGLRITRRDDSKILASHKGSFTSRALFPFDQPRRVEFYELRLAAHSVERADPHPPGTTENLVVSSGRVELEVDGDREVLEQGDAVLFQADVPHTYANSASAASVMFLVMTYPDTVG
jgi:transcriptional regulator with XRE-family HTH domain